MGKNSFIRKKLNEMEIKWANEKKLLESQVRSLKEELVHQEERLKKKFGAVSYETKTADQWTPNKHYSAPNSLSSGLSLPEYASSFARTKL